MSFWPLALSGAHMGKPRWAQSGSQIGPMWAAYVGPEWAQHGSHLVVFVVGSKWAPIIGPMWAEHVGPTSFWPLGPSGPIWANLDGAKVGPHLAQYWF